MDARRVQKVQDEWTKMVRGESIILVDFFAKIIVKYNVAMEDLLPADTLTSDENYRRDLKRCVKRYRGNELFTWDLHAFSVEEEAVLAKSNDAGENSVAVDLPPTQPRVLKSILKRPAEETNNGTGRRNAGGSEVTAHKRVRFADYGEIIFFSVIPSREERNDNVGLPGSPSLLDTSTIPISQRDTQKQPEEM